MTGEINTTLPQAYQDFERMGYKVSQNYGQSFVEIYGKTFTIKPWDTVWTVTHRKTLTNNEDEKNKLLGGLKALKEKFSIACKQFDINMENKKATRHEYVSFLMRNHVPNLINLKGTEAYEEGCALREAKYDASLKEIKALGRVLALNNSIQSQLSQIKHMA